MQDYMESRRGDDAAGAYAAYVGLDVHKDTIAVAVAEAGREPACYCGEIAHRWSAVAKLARDVAEAHGGEAILFCYEAIPNASFEASQNQTLFPKRSGSIHP